MATELNVQQIDLSGVSPGFQPADAAGNYFVNTGKELLVVQNNDTAAITVTIDSVTPCNYGFDHDVNVTVNAGETKYIGPFPVGRFNDDQRHVNITYSSTTNVQVAVIQT